MNEQERRQLQIELAADREALLAVASGVVGNDLDRDTRNPGWAVRDVLAHVLASDADLISLLEAASSLSADPIRINSLEQHQEEMARWMDATPQALAQEMRERGDRWRKLMAALPPSAFAITVGTSGWIKRAERLLDVISDWRGHDSQHGEDVKLALVDRSSGAAP
jgi:hypothetical protein